MAMVAAESIWGIPGSPSWAYLCLPPPTDSPAVQSQQAKVCLRVYKTKFQNLFVSVCNLNVRTRTQRAHKYKLQIGEANNTGVATAG